MAGGAEIDYYKYYNNVPDKASSYKGRCLLKFRVESERPKGYIAKLQKKKKSLTDVQPFMTKLTATLSRKNEPPTKDYYLKALVVSGNELPQFTEVSQRAVF